LFRIGRTLKDAFVRDESRYPTTGRKVDFSGVSQRDRAKRAAQAPVMGSNKNIDMRPGRGMAISQSQHHINLTIKRLPDSVQSPLSD